MGDSDARCGPASIQRFEGEDLSIASRVLGQNEQCRAWWEAELAKKQAEKEAEELHKRSIASRVSQFSLHIGLKSKEPCPEACMRFCRMKQNEMVRLSASFLAVSGMQSFHFRPA